MVIFHMDLTEMHQRLLLIIFIVGCIFSHYSTTYIFFMLLLFTWLIAEMAYALQKFYCPSYTTINVERFNSFFKPKLRWTILLLFFIAFFIWYSQITGHAFNRGLIFFEKTLQSLTIFFDMESRPSEINDLLGFGIGNKALTYRINWFFSWIAFGSIAIGVLAVLGDYCCKNFWNFEKLLKRPKIKYDMQFLILGIISSSLLVASIAVPHIYVGYDMGRTYFQMIVVLSSFFVAGGIIFSNLLHIKWKYAVIISILVPLIMCNTGMIDQLFNSPQTIILNSEGPEYNSYYITYPEVCGAKWLAQKSRNSIIYTDIIGSKRLVSQGLISKNRIDTHSINKRMSITDYIYLGDYSTNYDKLLVRLEGSPIMIDIPQYIYIIKNNIYDSRGTKIWL